MQNLQMPLCYENIVSKSDEFPIKNTLDSNYQYFLTQGILYEKLKKNVRYK